MAKAKAKNFVSEKGELMWMFIDGEGKKDLNGKPRFQASIRYKNKSKELTEMKKIIAEYWKENGPKGRKQKSNGIREEFEKVLDKKGLVVLDENGSPKEKATGYHLVNYWTGITFQDGKSKKVDIYNAAGAKVMFTKKIGNGSIGWISGAMGIYDREDGCGVTLYLNAVQLYKLIEFVGTTVLATPEDNDGWTGADEETGFESHDQEVSTEDSNINKESSTPPKLNL